MHYAVSVALTASSAGATRTCDGQAAPGLDPGKVLGQFQAWFWNCDAEQRGRGLASTTFIDGWRAISHRLQSGHTPMTTPPKSQNIHGAMNVFA
jgi:hypothetical protein